MEIDIRNHDEAINAINAALANKSIVEVKLEPKGVAVVEIKRTVKSISPATERK